jgi:hypothetical protein
VNALPFSDTIVALFPLGSCLAFVIAFAPTYSHLQCDPERPCERCKSRNIGHLCRDEEDDLHVMMQRYRDTMSVFNQTIREQRAASGLVRKTGDLIDFFVTK